MKIKNYITIFLAVIAIIALLGLAGYMTYLNTDDTNPFKKTVTSVIEEVNLEFGLGIDFDKLTHPIPMQKKTSVPVNVPKQEEVTVPATAPAE